MGEGEGSHRSVAREAKVGRGSVDLHRPGRNEKVTGKSRVWVAAAMAYCRVVDAVEGGPAEDEKGVINGGAGDTAMGTQGRACGGEGSVVKVAKAQGDGTALGGACEEEGRGEVTAEGVE